jgi:cytochrome c6
MCWYTAAKAPGGRHGLLSNLKGEVMKVDRRAISVLVVLACLSVMPISVRVAGGEDSGEALFKEHCAVCHPNGDNVVNPKKTLHKKDLEANNIKTTEDIVKKIRNPGPFPTHPQDWAGMKMFDQKTIPNENAMKIAEFILKTF